MPKKKNSAPAPDIADEHRVFSHIMYLLFLVAAALAFVFTIALLVENPETNYNGIKALVLIGWAFLFKTFGHRIHYPHH